MDKPKNAQDCGVLPTTKAYEREYRRGDKSLADLYRKAVEANGMERIGRCYELAGKFIFERQARQWLLVHGAINANKSLLMQMFGGKAPVDEDNPHAWCVTAGGELVWEPNSNKCFPGSRFADLFAAREIVRYTKAQVATLSMESDSYGPWDDESRRQHECYMNALRGQGIEITFLPENYPLVYPVSQLVRCMDILDRKAERR